MNIGMENEKLLHAIVWKVAKAYKFTHEELIGEGWLSWQKSMLTFDKDKGKLAPRLWGGVASLLKYSIMKEKGKESFASKWRVSHYKEENPETTWDSTFNLENIKDRQAEKEFEFPETLSSISIEIAKIALSIYDKTYEVPTKEELTTVLLDAGWKWKTIRESYKELSQYF